MDKNNSGSVAIGSLGIPSVVIGTLIALKKVGMTAMSYSDILWFGFDVFLVCAAVAIVVWLVIFIILALLGGFK